MYTRCWNTQSNLDHTDMFGYSLHAMEVLKTKSKHCHFSFQDFYNEYNTVSLTLNLHKILILTIKSKYLNYSYQLFYPIRYMFMTYLEDIFRQRLMYHHCHSNLFDIHKCHLFHTVSNRDGTCC